MIITIPVTRVGSNSSVPDVQVPFGPQEIQWVAGEGIAITSIAGLPNPPFTPPTAANNWLSTDINTVTTPTTFTYTVETTLLPESEIRRHDPQITNEPQ